MQKLAEIKIFEKPLHKQIYSYIEDISTWI